MKTYFKEVSISIILLVAAVKLAESVGVGKPGASEGSNNSGKLQGESMNWSGSAGGVNGGGTGGVSGGGTGGVNGGGMGGVNGGGTGGLNAGAPGNSASGANLGSTGGDGVTVPGMSSGYPCEIGELGKPASYDNKKEFWGDDGVSQTFKRTADQIEYRARRLGVSL